MFQSAPGFGAGGNRKLIRCRNLITRFQSAPGFGAGGNSIDHGQWSDHVRFNPPPALGPGETRAMFDKPRGSRVSIRPRLWGRGKRRRDQHREHVPNGFNPPPALGPGETGSNLSVSLRGRCFNPPPALGPGETLQRLDAGETEYVSIRPRLWGRGKREAAVGSDEATPSFNPPPALGPGETPREGNCGQFQCVSIRPRLWGRGKLCGQGRWVIDGNVSIRPRLWGRGKRRDPSVQAETIMFQSAPGFGAGGNAES